LNHDNTRDDLFREDYNAFLESCGIYVAYEYILLLYISVFVRMWHEVGENCIMRSFITFTLLQI
jgi:hypothetical protein